MYAFAHPLGYANAAVGPLVERPFIALRCGYEREMRPSTKVLTRAVWAACAFAALRIIFAISADTRRYDRLRKMSNDGPLIAQVPEMLAQSLDAERKALPPMLSALATLPSDAWRYVRMKTM